MFAFDSIPAVFGVTRDCSSYSPPTPSRSWGLRALYSLLAGSMDRFSYLKQGLAVLLVFIGLKVVISPFIHLPVTMSLAVIVVVVGGTVAASLWRDRARPRPADEQKRSVHP
jgi:tellurite resistance protein TerC